MNQYPYGTSGICPNTRGRAGWILEANAMMHNIYSESPYAPPNNARRIWIGDDMLRIAFGEGFGGANHGVASEFCDPDSSYVQCWDKNRILFFEDHELLDPVQFSELEKVVYQDLYSAPILLDVNRINYDTPIFNQGKEDTIVCLHNKCMPRSHINYFAQGAWSARLGETKEQLLTIILGWKFARHYASGDFDYYVPPTVFEWAEYGYDAYLKYEKKQIPSLYYCDSRRR